MNDKWDRDISERPELRKMGSLRGLRKKGSRYMVMHEFTQPQIDYFVDKCNFLPLEKEFFLLRTKGYTLDEIAGILPITRRSADNYSKKIKKKILNVL